MSHTPPRDTTGFTPQSKKTKSFGALFDDAEEALDGLKRKIEAEATQDSPSSTHSHSERSEELSGAATELNSMVMQVNGIRKRIGVVVEKNVDAIIRKEDGDEKENDGKEKTLVQDEFCAPDGGGLAGGRLGREFMDSEACIPSSYISHSFVDIFIVALSCAAHIQCANFVT